MGVPHLWDILMPAAEVRSLTHLAITEGFLCRKERGFRVGIDASIWLYHSAWSPEGENPELRMIFFRCCHLMAAGYLPLFVFDGPKRPKLKRGKHVNTSKEHLLTEGMKQVIRAFGFEYWMAPGEAEAELAWLNRTGAIDAVLSDDVDTFVFGATMMIRNNSKTLSGNKFKPVFNSEGKQDDEHTRVFQLDTIRSHPDISLDTCDMIFMALLMGGDYDEQGLRGCGPKVALGLVRAGFSKSLFEAFRDPEVNFPTFLEQWRHELRTELRTNASGHIGKKAVALSKSIPDDFPDIDVLRAYADPITSELYPNSAQRVCDLKWEKEPDVGKIACLCEDKFEWGYYEKLIYKLRMNVWPGIVIRVMRRAALESDKRGSTASNTVMSTPRRNGLREEVHSPGTPTKMITKFFSSITLDEDDNKPDDILIVNLHSARNHPSVDKMLEYRLEIDPSHLVLLVKSSIRYSRTEAEENMWKNASRPNATDGDDEGQCSSPGKERRKLEKLVDPNSTVREWFPACVVELVRGDLVQDFTLKQENKGKKKSSAKSRSTTAAKKGKGRRKAPVDSDEDGPSEGELPRLGQMSDDDSDSDSPPRRLFSNSQASRSSEMSLDSLPRNPVGTKSKDTLSYDSLSEPDENSLPPPVSRPVVGMSSDGLPIRDLTMKKTKPYVPASAPSGRKTVSSTSVKVPSSRLPSSKRTASTNSSSLSNELESRNASSSVSLPPVIGYSSSSSSAPKVPAQTKTKSLPIVSSADKFHQYQQRTDSSDDELPSPSRLMRTSGNTSEKAKAKALREKAYVSLSDSDGDSAISPRILPKPLVKAKSSTYPSTTTQISSAGATSHSSNVIFDNEAPSPSKRARHRHVSLSSIDSVELNKSPRKSKEQTSPRKNRTHNSLSHRPSSPTASRSSKSKPNTQNIPEVIDISSDEEPANVKASLRRTESTNGNVLKSSNRSRVPSQDDVFIDLT